MFKHLKHKGIINLDAATILKEHPNHHHCSSIHCSYYSCFQIIKYIVLTDLGLTEININQNREKESLINGSKIKKSEHEYLINFVYRHIINLNHLTEAQTFNENISKLKSLRNVSDYKNTLIEKDMSDVALSYAESIHKVLKKIYRYDQN